MTLTVNLMGLIMGSIELENKEVLLKWKEFIEAFVE